MTQGSNRSFGPRQLGHELLRYIVTLMVLIYSGMLVITVTLSNVQTLRLELTTVEVSYETYIYTWTLVMTFAAALLVSQIGRWRTRKPDSIFLRLDKIIWWVLMFSAAIVFIICAIIEYYNGLPDAVLLYGVLAALPLLVTIVNLRRFRAFLRDERKRRAR